MPRLNFNAHEGKGDWKPLPSGTYDVMFDSSSTGTSKGGHPQLVLDGHIVGGTNDGKKVKMWIVTKGGGWRIKGILDATDVEYTEEATGNVDAESRPEMTYEFDTDDLPGNIVRFDVSEDEYEGKPKNNFNNPRAPEKRAQKTAAAPAAAATAPAAAAAPAPAQAAAPQAAPEGRRRVVRGGGAAPAAS